MLSMCWDGSGHQRTVEGEQPEDTACKLTEARRQNETAGSGWWQVWRNVTQGGGRSVRGTDFQARYQGTSEIEQRLERVQKEPYGTLPSQEKSVFPGRERNNTKS